MTKVLMAGLCRTLWSQSESWLVTYNQLVLFRDLIENGKPIKIGLGKEDGKAKENVER